jgi:hypothetical protein
MSSPNLPDFPDFPDNSTLRSFLGLEPFNDFDALSIMRPESRSSSLNACFSRSRPSSITRGADCRSISPSSARPDDFDAFTTDGATALASDTVALTSEFDARNGIDPSPYITHCRSLACLPTLQYVADSNSSSEETTNDSDAIIPSRSQISIAGIRKSVSNFFQRRRRQVSKPAPITNDRRPAVHRAVSSRIPKNTRLPCVDPPRVRRTASFAGFAALSMFYREDGVESDEEEDEVASDAQVNPDSY